MDALEIFNFYYVHDISQKPVSLHNAYISYGHNFSIGSQNSTFENTRKVTISIELLLEIFKAMVWMLLKAVCPSDFFGGK